MADWTEMKTEYITGDISYRDLAEKHGVNRTTLATRAQSEKWVELRRQHRDKILTKSLFRDAKLKEDRMTRLLNSADKLLSKLDAAIDELDAVIVTKKERVKTEEIEDCTEYEYVREGEKGIIDRHGARNIASAIVDLQKVMTARPDLDEQEQEAKIARIRKETVDGNRKEVYFHIDGGADDFGD